MSRFEHNLFAVLILTPFIALVIIASCEATGSTLTAKCESGCLFGNRNVRGPGVLAVAWQTAEDAHAVPGVWIRVIPEGEYARFEIDPAWLREWLALFRRQTACVKWRWLRPPPGASKEWSEPGRWCFGVED